MKKSYLFFFMSILLGNLSAQDTIYLRNHQKIPARIQTIMPEKVKYSFGLDTSGVEYKIRKNEVKYIVLFKGDLVNSNNDTLRFEWVKEEKVRKQDLKHVRSDRVNLDDVTNKKVLRISQLDLSIDSLDRYYEFRDKKDRAAFAKAIGQIGLDTLKRKRAYNIIAKIANSQLEQLVSLLNLRNENADFGEIKYLVGFIRNFNTIYRLQNYISEQSKDSTVSSFIEENLNIVKQYYHQMIDREFHFYSYRDYQKTKIVGVELNHGNDFFDCIPQYNSEHKILREEKSSNFFIGNNHDRDMTGAFRMDIYTDYLQLRVSKIFTSIGWHVFNKCAEAIKAQRFLMDEDPFYSYQSAFVVGYGITPMLRDTSIFNKPNSFDPQDRPYFSFIGLGFSKNIIHRKGIFRAYSELAVGKVGSSSPYGIQAALHRDAIDASLNPNGWEAQVAGTVSPDQKAGRLGIQYMLKSDVMLLSSNKNITYLPKNFPKWMNIYVSTRINYGCAMTAADIGLGYTNYKFNLQNGNGLVKKSVNWKKIEWAPSIHANIYLRRLAHNSSLEGFGYFNHMYDGDPYTPKDTHVVKYEFVKRNLCVGNFGVSFSRGKANVFIDWNFTTPEIIREVNGIRSYEHYFEHDFDYKDTHFYFRRRASGLNFWGTMGFVFTI